MVDGWWLMVESIYYTLMYDKIFPFTKFCQSFMSKYSSIYIWKRLKKQTFFAETIQAKILTYFCYGYFPTSNCINETSCGAAIQMKFVLWFYYYLNFNAIKAYLWQKKWLTSKLESKIFHWSRLVEECMKKLACQECKNQLIL